MNLISLQLKLQTKPTVKKLFQCLDNLRSVLQRGFSHQFKQNSKHMYSFWLLLCVQEECG